MTAHRNQKHFRRGFLGSIFAGGLSPGTGSWHGGTVAPTTASGEPGAVSPSIWLSTRWKRPSCCRKSCSTLREWAGQRQCPCMAPSMGLCPTAHPIPASPPCAQPHARSQDTSLGAQRLLPGDGGCRAHPGCSTASPRLSGMAEPVRRGLAPEQPLAGAWGAEWPFGSFYHGIMDGYSWKGP